MVAYVAWDVAVRCLAAWGAPALPSLFHPPDWILHVPLPQPNPSSSGHHFLLRGPLRAPISAGLTTLIAWVALACGGGGGSGWVSPLAFDTAEVVVEQDGRSARVLVEVAESQQEKQFGLSRRDHLAPESGMLFLFDEPRAGDDGFWMWRTEIPLDIAFIDSLGVVVRVMQMPPCTATRVEACPEYEPGSPYASALEMNMGWFAEKGFSEGMTVTRVP